MAASFRVAPTPVLSRRRPGARVATPRRHLRYSDCARGSVRPRGGQLEHVAPCWSRKAHEARPCTRARARPSRQPAKETIPVHAWVVIDAASRRRTRQCARTATPGVSVSGMVSVGDSRYHVALSMKVSAVSSLASAPCQPAQAHAEHGRCETVPPSSKSNPPERFAPIDVTGHASPVIDSQCAGYRTLCQANRSGSVRDRQNRRALQAQSPLEKAARTTQVRDDSTVQKLRKWGHIYIHAGA